MKLEDLHFWETYWVFVVSLVSGIMVGFGLNGKEISVFFPILIPLWFGLVAFHWFFTKVKRINSN